MADERIGIHIGLDGADTTIRSLKDLIRYRDELAKAKDISLFNTEKARQEVMRLTTQLENLRKTRDDMKRTGEDFILPGKFKQIEQEIKDTEAALRGAKVTLANGTKDIANLNSELSRTKSELNGVNAGIESLANAFSKIGDFSGAIGNFASGIGNAFSGMAGLFQSNFIDVVGMKLTAMMTEAFVGHGQDVIARADILNTFEDYMEITGVSARDANAALEKVDQSIRGLPIGLDESAQRLRRYQMFLGDIDKATNITIGLQKAITAGGANESMKRMAYYQIDRLLSVGELSTARQWNSLITGLGVSVKFLAEAMGEGEMSASELAGAMLNGQFSAEQLLDALAKLGEGGNAGLEKALEIYKGTYQSWLSNIRFAMVRGATNILEAFSDTLEDSAGKSIVGYMKTIRDGMNEMYKGIANWIRVNPGLIGTLADSIERLVGAFTSLQFGTFGTSFFGYLTQAVDILTNALAKIGGTDLSQFVAFATTIAGPLGKLFSAMSSGLPILIGVFQRFKDFDFEGLVNTIIRYAGALATVVENLLNLFSDSVMSNLLAFGITFGKPLATAFHGISNAILYLGVASTTASGGINALVAGLSKLGGFVGPAAAIGASIMVLGHIYDSWKEYQKELTFFAEQSAGTSINDQMIRGFEQQRDASKNAADAARENVEALESYDEKSKELINTVSKLNNASKLSASDQATMLNAISQLNGMYSDWDLAIDETTGKLDDSSARIIKNADAMKQAAVIAGQQNYLDVLGSSLAESTANRRVAMARLAAINMANRPLIEGQMAQAYRQYVEEFGAIELNSQSATNFANWLINDLQIAPDEKTVDQFIRSYQEYEEQVAGFQNQIKIYDGEIKEYEGAMDELSGTITDASNEIRKNAETLVDVGALYDEVFAQIIEGVDEATSAFDDLGETALKTGEDILQGSQNTLEAYQQYLEDLATLRELQERLNREGKITDAGGNTITETEYDQMLGELIERGDWGEIHGVSELARGYDEADIINNLYRFIANRSLIEGELATEEAHLKTTMTIEATGVDVDESQLDLSGVNAAGEAAGQAFNDSMATAMRYQREEDMFNETFGGNIDTSEAQSQLGELESAAGSATGAMEDLGSASSDASSEIVSSSQTAASTGGSNFDTLSGHIDDVSSALDTAVGKVSNLISQLGSIPTEVNVSVNVRQNGSVRDVHIPAGGQLMSNGGAVYAANGKLINGPRGTDTIPAWLTAGEFVQNRRAVNYFGLPFMQHVNNLDLTGALKSLLSMKNIPAFAGGGSVTNHYTRDNHATVNQTIVTNNQNYSQRVALRALNRL